jgi:ABC-2 type transport system permease protein
MRKFGLIARQEYLRNVRRRSFLATTFGLPVLMIALMAISIVASGTGGGDPDSLGYVDQGGVLAARAGDPGFRSFSTVDAAAAALEAQEIDGFYVLAPDYAASGKIELLYWDRPPGATLQDKFESFLRTNLVEPFPSDVAARTLEGPATPVVRTADGSRETDSPGMVSLILPFALGLFISFALMNASGYLMQAVTDEKENRTIEVMTTSVSPREFIAGKAVGLAGVALSQVLLWAVVVVAGIAVASRFVDSLSAIAVSWGLVLMLIAFFIPLFTLAVALVVTLGVAVADSRQGQQLTGVITFAFLIPLFFSPLLGSNPDGPLMVALTLFPTTSLLTIAVRWSATAIPYWQLIASWLILALCAGIGIWAAPRVFRQGMLRYGKRMSLRGVIEAVRARG